MDETIKCEKNRQMTFSTRDVNLPTAELELFDDVTDLLKPVSVTLLFALIVGDYLHGQTARVHRHALNSLIQI